MLHELNIQPPQDKNAMQRLVDDVGKAVGSSSKNTGKKKKRDRSPEESKGRKRQKGEDPNESEEEET